VLPQSREKDIGDLCRHGMRLVGFVAMLQYNGDRCALRNPDDLLPRGEGGDLGVVSLAVSWFCVGSRWRARPIGPTSSCRGDVHKLVDSRGGSRRWRISVGGRRRCAEGGNGRIIVFVGAGARAARKWACSECRRRSGSGSVTVFVCADGR
jgi:hypothetical protein